MIMTMNGHARTWLQTGRQIDGVDRQTDRQTDRQKEKEKERERVKQKAIELKMKKENERMKQRCTGKTTENARNYKEKPRVRK